MSAGVVDVWAACWRGSPVRLGVVRAELLPQDPVCPRRGQEVARSLHPASQFHLLHLYGHLHIQQETT